MHLTIGFQKARLWVLRFKVSPKQGSRFPKNEVLGFQKTRILGLGFPKNESLGFHILRLTDSTYIYS